MFSVNIDKLVDMTSNERRSYEEVAVIIKEGLDGGRSLSVIGGGLKAFKLAYSFTKSDSKVLFIDGDISSEVFLGKYKLGKNMKGVTDYLKKPDKDYEMICKTNESNLDIIFTGALDDGKISSEEEKQMKELIARFSEEYDYIIVDSDNEGVLSPYCQGTILMYSENEYGEIAAEKLTSELEARDCNVLGVIINE